MNREAEMIEQQVGIRVIVNNNEWGKGPDRSLRKPSQQQRPPRGVGGSCNVHVPKHRLSFQGAPGGGAPGGGPPVQGAPQAGGGGGGGGADYSAQWAEYYRSVGKVKEAEAIESQMRQKVRWCLLTC